MKNICESRRKHKVGQIFDTHITDKGALLKNIKNSFPTNQYKARVSVGKQEKVMNGHFIKKTHLT